MCVVDDEMHTGNSNSVIEELLRRVWILSEDLYFLAVFDASD
jgi:hypothetical protein